MTTNPSFELFYLLSHPRITRKKVHHYLLSDTRLNRLQSLNINELCYYFSISQSIAQSLQSYLHSSVQRKQAFTRFADLKPITIYDFEYPETLASIPDPPLILYVRGNRDLLVGHHLSVIGSRKPSPSARDKIQLLLPPIIEQSVAIVSGLAYGIDSMSHQLALEKQGKTIAVLAFGFNHIYPASHLNLYQAIEKNGLLISEYPPETKPQRWHFPERNRIISGLSLATLIIEAAVRSGTMITADQALEQGKDVWVVPDSIFLPEAEGCLKLLREGAIPITSSEDIQHWWKKITNRLL